MADDSADVTRWLARRLVASRREEVSADVRHEAARALLNWCGCAIGASRHETVDNLLAALLPFAGVPQAQILGRRERTDCLHAALANGVASHVFDFDDTHARAIHPSAPVYPAILALAEWKKISGADLVHAFVLGVEAECRIGLSVFPEHYMIGWHITGTAGVFGAAAAAGKLLGLNEQQMAWALGIAATQSSGLREMFGSMCKSLHPGRAAQGGLAAALMAEKNFTSSEQGIEAKRGFGHVMSTKFDPSIITADWGRSWELSQNMYKPYACGLVVQGTIDGCIQLRNEQGLKPEMIESVDLRVSPIVFELTAKENPQTGLEGKFSVFHAAAVALHTGKAGEAQFSDASVLDPVTVALRRRVRIERDESIGRVQSHISIRTRDGRVLERHVVHALGTLERPMSDADLEAKFRGLAEGILDDRQADEVIRLCWDVEHLPDAGTIARAAAP
ncbi:MAG: MmgE/PrpD family protein [Betaproteobacteria bacterium]|jgi:2-methylcitrate dehydratase PrpD